MKMHLTAALTRSSFFLLALAAGFVGYFIAEELGARTGADAGVSAHRPAPPIRLQEDLVLDAEAHLLARADSPVDFVGDALGIFYILQQDGRVLRVAPTLGGGSSATVYTEFADADTEREIGFSSLSLHPGFLDKENPGYGRLYVVAAEKSGSGTADFVPAFGGGSEDHQDVVYEYTIEDPLLSAFRGTRREIMRLSQPGREHNLSSLSFDPLGHLYLGVGDGAAGKTGDDQPSRNASTLSTAFGKILRIDPLGNDSANGRYGIPEGNPFRLVTEALPELWAFGLRAPRDLSFDPFRRTLCITERGARGRDEINLSALGGEHFGWDLDEDSARMSPAMRRQLAEITTPPLLALDRPQGPLGRAAGSLVYRGENFPALAGRIVFASQDGQLLAARPSTSSDGPAVELSRLRLASLGEETFTALRTGPLGELVVLCEDGDVYEFRKGASLGTGGSKSRSLFCLIESVTVPGS
ncbi:MAG: PQQ-dependent sugar dehydrogenase [Verrucomicrobiaceae bacterium]|nr:PQQ-dependent sugar dehydrogenase [Verrucomicrobiaceae bacterium]